MTPRKDHSPLFESIRRGDKSSGGGLQLPKWMQQSASDHMPTEAKGAAKPAEKHAATGEPSSPTPATTTSAPSTPSWLSGSVVISTRRSAAMVLTALVVFSIVGAYVAGRTAERHAYLARQSNFEKQVEALAGAREAPANYGLIPPHVAGVDDRREVPGGAVATTDAQSAQPDPRQPGLNYFRLVQLPNSSRAAGDRIVAFLADHGVDAAMIPVNNGRSYKLMALKGFDRPLSDPQAKAYQQKLLALGRKWKDELGGSTNWSDMIAEKYRPSRN